MAEPEAGLNPDDVKGGKQVPFANAIEGIKERVSQITEDKKMSADLLFMNTYMASLALADASRPEIFTFAANRKEYISAKYIAKVDMFVKKWSYSYAEALSIQAERIKNPMLQSMLNRYANAIESGVPDDDFLKNELSTVRSVYRSQVEAGLEMVQKWGDAYIAMLLSGTVICVTLMISIAIYNPTGLETTLYTGYGIILAIGVGGNFLMYTSVPDDPKAHGLTVHQSKEQQTIHAMERIIIPIAVVAVILLSLVGASAAMIYILIGILLAPLGIIGYIDDSNITMRDNDFSTFVRSLGAVMGGQGTTAVHALNTIDKKSLTALEPLVNSVYSKMNLGLDDKQIWDKFIGESGSNLIYKYLNIFRDAVELGGKPDIIGQIVGSSMLEQVLLREKRNSIAMGFVILLVPMHAMMVGIFLFLYHIMVMMSKAISSVVAELGSSSSALSNPGTVGGSLGGSGLSMFVNFPEQEVGLFVVIMIIIITIANVIAGKIVMGGDRYMYYFFSSLLLLVTGIIYIAAPVIVAMFFNIPTFQGV